MIFKGTGSQGNYLYALSKNHIGFLKEEGTEIRVFKDFPYCVFRKKLWQFERKRGNEGNPL